MFDKIKMDIMLKKAAKEYRKSLSDLCDTYIKDEAADKNKRSKVLNKKVAAIILIMAMAVTLVGCWKPIYRFTVYIYDIFADIIYKTSDIKIISIDDITLNYMPDGYKLVNVIMDEDIKFYKLKKLNNDLSICLQLTENGTKKGVDIEDAEFVRSPEKFVIEKDDGVMLIVQIKNISVEIVGNIDKADAVKIVNNITW